MNRIWIWEEDGKTYMTPIEAVADKHNLSQEEQFKTATLSKKVDIYQLENSKIYCKPVGNGIYRVICIIDNYIDLEEARDAIQYDIDFHKKMKKEGVIK